MRSYVPLQPPIVQPRADALYDYQEFPPSKELAPYVACYWIVSTRAPVPAGVHRVVPDGCVDIIVDLRARSHAKAAFVAGFMTASATMPLPAQHALFGIRFYLEHAHRFMRSPVSSFARCHVYLEESWGKEASSFVDAVAEATGTRDRLERVERELKKCLASAGAQENVPLQASLAYMYERRGAISVRELADYAGYSERHVRRAFLQEYGIRPKEVLDIVRFQFLLRELHQQAFPSFADMALQYGYYDQSHLIRHFKRYYGMSPGQVFA